MVFSSCASAVPADMTGMDAASRAAAAIERPLAIIDLENTSAICSSSFDLACASLESRWRFEMPRGKPPPHRALPVLDKSRARA
jgi:hypothetical protein